MEHRSDGPTEKVDLSVEELFEFGLAIAERRLELDAAVARLKTFSNETLCKLFDTVCAIDQGMPATSNEEEKKDNPFKEFIRILSDAYIPEEVLCLEIGDMLDPNTSQALVRTRTRLYYKQVKFNLMREESEGFSKLVTELIDNDTELSSKEICNRVFALIGQFNLDPNRVCDLILECFEAHLDRSLEFIDLLRELSVNREYITTLLGFKFTFYHKEETPTPFSLYLVAAYLIDSGFVNLSEICPYLTISPEKFKELRQKQLENASKRSKHAEVIHTSNIVIEAKAQTQLDSGEAVGVTGIPFATVVAQQESEDLKLAENFEENKTLGINQKVGLICALCEIGAWEPAKELLDCMPDGLAVTGIPRLSRAIATMIETSLDDFYKQKCRSHYVRNPSTREASMARKPALPKVSDWNGLCELTKVIGYLGPRLAYRPSCYTKLLRLLHVFIVENKIYAGNKNEEFSDIPLLLDSVIIPGMSLLDENSGVAEEIWGLLQMFPYQERFRFYGRWKSTHTVRYCELLIQRGKLLGRTKYLLKRLSKESSRQMGRQLSKLCLVYPFTVFDYLLSQVQTFDNFIEPVVESIRFLSSLSLDVLIYCIMIQLASSHKQQIKESDGSLSAWLQSLGALTGNVFKRYNAELLAMLHYIVNQLKVEKSFDLLILREIVHMMGGIEAYSGLTHEHLEALSGGVTLRQEGASFAGAKNKRACTRLKETLLQDDLAIGLYVLMGQQHQCLSFKGSVEYPLKLTGELVDQCRDTMLQFSEFLVTNLSNNDYCNMCPPIEDLLGKYKLSVDMAMSLYRPVFMAEVYKVYKVSLEALKASEKSDEEMEADIEPGEVKETGERNGTRNGTSKFNAALEQSFFKAALEEVLESVAERIAPHISTYSNQMNIKTYCLFWLLSRYDLEVPTSAYERVIEKVKRQLADLGSSHEVRAKRKEEERLKSVIVKLGDELRTQKEHVERMHMAFMALKDDFFVATNLKGPVAGSFLQTCLMNRAIVSDADALYAAAFFKKLHSIRAANYNTLLIVDKIFSDILPLLLGLTENEAGSLGCFLQAMMENVLNWRNPSVYEKECYGSPGFERKVKPEDRLVPIDLKGFQRLCFKYQFHTGKTFANLLTRKDEDYIVIRNSLLFLTKVLPVFPVVKFIADDIWMIVDKLREQEKGKRDDLALKAASYTSHLKMRKVKIYETGEFATELNKPIPTSLLPKTDADNKAAKKRKSKASKSVEGDDAALAKQPRLTEENGNETKTNDVDGETVTESRKERKRERKEQPKEKPEKERNGSSKIAESGDNGSATVKERVRTRAKD